MNLKPRKPKLSLIAMICLPAFLGACATARSGPVSKVPAVATGTDAGSANPVPVAGEQANPAVCEKLAEEAAQTTLMVVEFQKWYREQASAFAVQNK